MSQLNKRLDAAQFQALLNVNTYLSVMCTRSISLPNAYYRGQYTWLCGQRTALCDLSVLSWSLKQKEQMCWNLQFGNEQPGCESLFRDLQMPL